MKHVMIDIETMGTHTSRSLILSVGAVAFELCRDAPAFADETFLRVLTLEPQVLRGRLIEKDTQNWWEQQTPQAREHWESAKEKLNPSYLGSELREFFEKHSGPETYVWANGIVFDIGNLENLFSEYSSSIPWKYNVVRDARTMYGLPKRREMPQELTFVGHDPLEDCRKQIWRLWEHTPEELLG